MNSILKIDDNYKIDESIDNYETYSFYPITGTQLNNPGSITITVQNSDNLYHPANSWLEFEGQIKNGVAAFEDSDLITLANNGILHLFDNIKYLLSSTEIESVFNPGTVSNVMGLAKYPSSFKSGLIQCWAPDVNNNASITGPTVNEGFKKRHDFFMAKSTPVGSFRIAVPLKHIFGFAEDYNKVLYGFVHTLVLNRSSSDKNALFSATAVTDTGSVHLENIRWMLPRVSPSEVVRYEFVKQIESEKIINVGFRMRQSISTAVPTTNQFEWRLGVRSSPEKPRYIFLVFQTDRMENQKKNISTYDHCNLTSAHVLLNNDRYPLNDFETNFAKNHYDHLFHEFSSFIQKYYKVDDMITSTLVDPVTYKECFPIILFDVSKQSDRLKTGVTDITLKCHFSANVPASTIAHAVMISDRKLRFKTDGQKTTVLF